MAWLDWDVASSVRPTRGATPPVQLVAITPSHRCAWVAMEVSSIMLEMMPTPVRQCIGFPICFSPIVQDHAADARQRYSGGISNPAVVVPGGINWVFVHFSVDEFFSPRLLNSSIVIAFQLSTRNVQLQLNYCHLGHANAYYKAVTRPERKRIKDGEE